MWGVGFGVQGPIIIHGVGPHASWMDSSGLGLGFKGSGFKMWGLGFMVWGLAYRV